MERVRTEGAAVLFSFSAAGQPWRSTMASQGLSQSRGSPADGWVSHPLGGPLVLTPPPPTRNFHPRTVSCTEGAHSRHSRKEPPWCLVCL